MSATPPDTTRSRYYYEQRQGEIVAKSGDHVWGWGSPGGRRRLARRAQMYVDHGGMHQDGWTLEVGCGTGLFTAEVRARAQTKMLAFDVSLDLARLAKAENPGVRFVVAACEALPFPDGVITTVYGSSVLHHLALDESLPELRRVCTPGARLVFTEPNMVNPQILVQKNVPWVARLVHDIPGETAFVRWLLARVLRRFGFAEIVIDPFDFLHPFTPAALVDGMDRFTRFLERIPLLREIAGSVLIIFRTPQ